MRNRVVIMGAGGRDFHNFNVFFRDNPSYEVIGFTAAQIPNIENRRYPSQLAGKLYPKGIPIYPETKLSELIKKYKVNLVVFAYSDVSFEWVMEKASEAIAAGADYLLLGPDSTMLTSKKPVLAIGAVRTGAGKSPTSRRIAKILKEKKINFCIVRHPMAYGNLTRQIVQKFTNFKDLDREECTIEEREEYEPHLSQNITIFAGVDYKKILEECEKDFDLIIWEGGNNDFPFYKPNLLIVVVDPLRAGHETKYHPGASLFRMADVIVINKVNTAKKEDVEEVKRNAKRLNPDALIIEAYSSITVENPELIRNKRVVVVEDGPTLTHGEMTFGAGIIASKEFEAKEIVDPRPYIKGSIKDKLEEYPKIKNLLPCLGYGKAQLKELEEILNKIPADSIIIGTPVDIRKIMKLNKPATRVFYEVEEKAEHTLKEVVEKFLKREGLC